MPRRSLKIEVPYVFPTIFRSGGLGCCLCFPEGTGAGSKTSGGVAQAAGVTPASRLEVRPAPEMVSSGIREIDGLSGGLPRGCLSEICGSASSGRTSVLLAALAAATRREEVCALVDTTDALDAVSAAAAGVDLERLLWVRCGKAGVGLRTSDLGPRASDGRTRSLDAGSNVRRPRSDFRSLEQALRVTDLLLQSGGFGLVAIDLGDVPHCGGAAHAAGFLVSFSASRRAYAHGAFGSGPGALCTDLRFPVDQASVREKAVRDLLSALS